MSMIESDDRQLRPATTETAVARETAAVQAAMIAAKKFPRDESTALDRVLKSCKRRGLAEVACYEYAKGGTKISGPSIRLAEVMAQNWGNMDFGFREVERKPARAGNPGESTVEAYAWDLETNVRRSMVFSVLHVRDTKQGRKPLSDEREIYELVANQASRRIRACILAVIPGDIQDAAVEQCEKTLQGSSEPVREQVAKMLQAFATIGVSSEMVAARVQHSVDAITAGELATLRRVYASIRDGFESVAHFFPSTEPQQTGRNMTPALTQDSDGDMGARE